MDRSAGVTARDPRQAAQRLLRWYPAEWRDRYGDELVALIEDEHEDRPPTMYARSEVALAGLRERARQAGLIGDRRSPAERLWTGALLVLCGWSVFMVGGAAFQRQSEHFVGGVPVHARAVPVDAFTVVQLLAVTGIVLVGIGALVAMPAFVRFLRAGGWRDLWVQAAWALGTTAVFGGVLAGLAGWAHSLSPVARNGGSTSYSLAFAAVGLVGLATLAQWTALAVVAARRLEVSPRLRATEGLLAVVLFGVMAAITVSTGLWWGTMTTSAPWVLTGSTPGTHTPAVTAFMVTAATCMVAGTALAAYGVGRMRSARLVQRAA
jgi:hypothetical protein